MLPSRQAICCPDVRHEDLLGSNARSEQTLATSSRLCMTGGYRASSHTHFHSVQSSCTDARLLLPELSILPGVGQPRKLFSGLLSVSGNVASWDDSHSSYPCLQVAAHACGGAP